MITRAPGKIVISGAYSVLEGAPAIVAAVDRYVTADTSRAPVFVTPELRAAQGGSEVGAPYFDASALRDGDRKLGLGSSAAILVACLGAIVAARPDGPTSDEALRKAVLGPAIRAHREAQGGGSGIDVATSTLGGIVVARRRPGVGELDLDQVAGLPADLHVRVLFAGVPASTPELVARVRAFAGASPAEYRALIAELTAGAVAAETALRQGSAAAFIAALSLQLDGFARLGERAGASIVTAEVNRLARLARDANAVVLPAGAGGGDVAIYVGLAEPTQALTAAILEEGHQDLGLGLGAAGLQRFG